MDFKGKREGTAMEASKHETFGLSARGLAARAVAQNPSKRFAVGRRAGDVEFTALAYWDGAAWIMFAGLLIDKTWGRIPNLCVNGRPVVDEWEAV